MSTRGDRYKEQYIQRISFRAWLYDDYDVFERVLLDMSKFVTEAQYPYPPATVEEPDKFEYFLRILPAKLVAIEGSRREYFMNGTRSDREGNVIKKKFEECEEMAERRRELARVTGQKLLDLDEVWFAAIYIETFHHSKYLAEQEVDVEIYYCDPAAEACVDRLAHRLQSRFRRKEGPIVVNATTTSAFQLLAPVASGMSERHIGSDVTPATEPVATTDQNITDQIAEIIGDSDLAVRVEDLSSKPPFYTVTQSTRKSTILLGLIKLAAKERRQGWGALQRRDWLPKHNKVRAIYGEPTSESWSNLADMDNMRKTEKRFEEKWREYVAQNKSQNTS